MRSKPVRLRSSRIKASISADRRNTMEKRNMFFLLFRRAAPQHSGNDPRRHHSYTEWYIPKLSLIHIYQQLSLKVAERLVPIVRDAIAGDLDKGRLTCVEDPETVAAFCGYGQLGRCV